MKLFKDMDDTAKSGLSLLALAVLLLMISAFFTGKHTVSTIHIQEMQTDYDGNPLSEEEHGWSVDGHEYAFAFPDFSYAVIPDADIFVDSSLEEGEAVLDVSKDGVRLRLKSINPCIKCRVGTQ